MSLRDIRNPDEFKTFANTLKRNIKALDAVGLQRLQHEMAIALGARSLEAYLAQMSNAKSDEPAAKPLFPSEPYVLVREVNGQLHYWNGEKQVGHLYPVNEKSFSAQECYPRIMSEQKAGQALLCVDSMKRSEYRIMPLREANPELFEFLTAQTEIEVSALLKKYNVKSCGYLYCDHEDWYSEYQSGDTVLFYQEWLLHQMETHRDEINQLYF